MQYSQPSVLHTYLRWQGSYDSVTKTADQPILTSESILAEPTQESMLPSFTSPAPQTQTADSYALRFTSLVPLCLLRESAADRWQGICVHSPTPYTFSFTNQAESCASYNVDDLCCW